MVVSCEAGFILKATGKCSVRPVFLYCCEMWELTVLDEMSLCGWMWGGGAFYDQAAVWGDTG